MTSRLNWRDSLYKKHLIQRGWCVKTVAENELSWETKRGRVLKSPLKFHKNESTTLYQARVALPDHHDLRIFSEDGADSNTWGASRSLMKKRVVGKNGMAAIGWFQKNASRRKGERIPNLFSISIYKWWFQRSFVFFCHFYSSGKKHVHMWIFFRWDEFLACENFASQDASGGSGG